MPLGETDSVVPSNLQISVAIDGLLTRAEASCLEQGRAESDLMEARLLPTSAVRLPGKIPRSAFN